MPIRVGIPLLREIEAQAGARKAWTPFREVQNIFEALPASEKIFNALRQGIEFPEQTVVASQLFVQPEVVGCND